MEDINEILKRRIVYEVDNMKDVRVYKNIAYKNVADKKLNMDIYIPKGISMGFKYPAVILVHGDGPAEILENIKDSGQYVSLGQLIAASGLIAITFNHRSSYELTKMEDVATDIEDSINYIKENAEKFNINKDELGLWAISAGVPYGISVALRNRQPYIKCLVSYYGYLDLQHRKEEISEDVTIEQLKEFSPVNYLKEIKNEIPPLFIARAGLDHPVINKSIDNFIRELLNKNIDFNLYNHSKGEHGFDLMNDNVRTYEIIRRTIEFLKEHLRIE
ncbi:MAG: prolyl oligopeptidase family serine peptidase [Maledivibacter sp.]|jgi:acetyl esterase/lipase|nr:prolyl oligopeptidase family serine peptidase [Maledivibacter sp.]